MSFSKLWRVISWSILIFIILFLAISTRAAMSNDLYLPFVGKPGPVRSIDPRIDLLPATIEFHDPTPGESYWRLVELVWQNEEEAEGRHSINLDVVDGDGNRIVGQGATVSWSSGSAPITQSARPEPYGADFPMFAAGCSYALAIDDLPGDTLSCLGLGTPEQPEWTIHTQFLLRYELVVP